MAQPTVASYFNARKRPAIEEISKSNVKRFILDQNNSDYCEFKEKIMVNSKVNSQIIKKDILQNIPDLKTAASAKIQTPKTPRRVVTARKKVDTKQKKIEDVFDKVSKKSEQNLLDEYPKTPPKKTKTSENEKLVEDTFETNKNEVNDTKPADSIPDNENVKDLNEKVLNQDNNDAKIDFETKPNLYVSTIDKLANKNVNSMPLNEIKSKLSRSSRLAELKASLIKFNKISENVEKIDKDLKNHENLKIQNQLKLKQFSTIEVEVPISPKKINQTPEKPYLSPIKKPINIESKQSPRKNLFGTLRSSPASPSKLAAYERYAHLTVPTLEQKSHLTLPTKYRHLAEIFRTCDEICSMMYKKQLITFDKLKQAVQQRLRRNLNETHLAQIKFIYPESYELIQKRVRSFGTGLNNFKYELVIIPILNEQHVPTDTVDNGQGENNGPAMPLTILLERRRTFFNLLIEKLKDYHDEFLKSLNPPMQIQRDKILRWHPEFDIEQIPDIEAIELPKPPSCTLNGTSISSAKDILLKAKEMFNCNTKMEAALQRLAEYQEKREATNNSCESAVDNKDKQKLVINNPPNKEKEEIEQNMNDKTVQTKEVATNDGEKKTVLNYNEKLLKGIPAKLLEKIRAREAAKELDAMTRDPKKDREAHQYAQLPDLAKFLRNIFITERKNVLLFDFIVNKLNNSFRTNLRPKEYEELLKLLEKESNGWIEFHQTRRQMFIKISKNIDINQLVEKLEEVAQFKK